MLILRENKLDGLLFAKRGGDASKIVRALDYSALAG
jgi:hypothetical protein